MCDDEEDDDYYTIVVIVVAVISSIAAAWSVALGSGFVSFRVPYMKLHNTISRGADLHAPRRCGDEGDEII